MYCGPQCRVKAFKEKRLSLELANDEGSKNKGYGDDEEVDENEDQVVFGILR